MSLRSQITLYMTLVMCFASGFGIGLTMVLSGTTNDLGTIATVANLMWTMLVAYKLMATINDYRAEGEESVRDEERRIAAANLAFWRKSAEAEARKRADEQDQQRVRLLAQEEAKQS